jgi:hypothetical protein
MASRPDRPAVLLLGALLALPAGLARVALDPGTAAAAPAAAPAAAARDAGATAGKRPGEAGGEADRERFFADSARLDRIASIYAAYYRLPRLVPDRLLRIGLSPDDVSVTLWLAAASVADPHAIASARLKASPPWHTLLRAYHVSPGRLAVRLDGPPPASGPYARAYRVLAGQARGALTDAEVRDLVQLRLLAEHFRVQPAQVVARRTAGTSAVDLIFGGRTGAGVRATGHAPAR